MSNSVHREFNLIRRDDQFKHKNMVKFYTLITINLTSRCQYTNKNRREKLVESDDQFQNNDVSDDYIRDFLRKVTIILCIFGTTSDFKSCT